MIAIAIVLASGWSAGAAAQMKATAQFKFRTPGWQVVIAMPVYFPDGTVREATIDLDRTATGEAVYFFGGQPSVCQPAVWPGAVPDSAGVGWRVSVTAAHEAGRARAGVRWQRVRAGTVDPAVQSIDLTLRPGDRIPLDFLRSTEVTAADCKPVGASLEVRTTLPDMRLADPAQTDLWLVVQAPGGAAEETQHRAFRLQPGMQVDYVFDDVPVLTPQGETGITVRGLLQLLDVTNGTIRMRLNVARGVRVGGSSAPDARIILKNWGSAQMTGRTMVIAFEAKPGEVVGFTLPPFVNEPGDGYRLSLRLRAPAIR
jgi:hypothetical protein